MSREKIKKKLLEQIKKFKEKSKSEKIIIFGSFASKNFSQDSDVDLIIVSKKFRKLDFFKRGAMMYNYWNMNYPVDFLCYTPEEFNKLKKRITIVGQALEKGIVI